MEVKDMSSLISRLAPAGLVISLAVAGAAFAQPKGDQCALVELSGESEQLQPGGSFEGVKTLTVLETGEHIPLAEVAHMLGVVSENNGVLQGVTSHALRSEGGGHVEFITVDDGTLVPVPGGPLPYALVLRMEVLTGSGRYNCGTLVSGFGLEDGAPDSWISLADGTNPGRVIFTARGRLCRCRGD
jgi:hypothetical protein